MRSVLEKVVRARGNRQRSKQKRQKRESEAGVVWGEEMTVATEERNNFLYEGVAQAWRDVHDDPQRSST